jgi:two-component system nitrogen regulation sensor histidine kinase NtrY
MKLTFGRLAPKLLLLMLLMAGVPLLVAWGLSARLFDRSLGAGLNPEIGRALSDAVEVFGERIRAEKAHHRAVAAGLADSARLHAALRADDHAEVDRLLGAALETPSALEVWLFPGPAFPPMHVRQALNSPPDWLRETVTLPLPADTGYASIAYTFGLDPAYLARFHRMEAEVITPFNTMEADRERRASLYAWSFVGTLGAAILGAGAIALIAGGRVTRRIYRLQRAMMQVAAGRFDTRVVVSGHDEVTELMTGFNQMTAQLQEGRARIEYLTQISAWQGIARRMAHEIKNPLTPILLSVQQAESAYRGDDAQHRRTLGTMRTIVEQEVHTLRRLVDAFSQFAQLPQVHRVPTDVAALCRDVVAAHPEIAGLSVDAPDTSVVAHADAGLLRQALTNLINNAAQAIASAPGAPAPSVRLRCTPTSAGVELVVSDNGPGVPVSAREQIFEPYVTGRVDGTGLGLAIVKRIALDHEGSVEVIGPFEGGAVFRLFLPTPGSATMQNARVDARDSDDTGGVTASRGHVTGQLDAERVAGRAVGREHRRS